MVPVHLATVRHYSLLAIVSTRLAAVVLHAFLFSDLLIQLSRLFNAKRKTAEAPIETNGVCTTLLDYSSENTIAEGAGVGSDPDVQ